MQLWLWNKKAFLLMHFNFQSNCNCKCNYWRTEHDHQTCSHLLIRSVAEEGLVPAEKVAGQFSSLLHKKNPQSIEKCVCVIPAHSPRSWMLSLKTEPNSSDRTLMQKQEECSCSVDTGMDSIRVVHSADKQQEAGQGLLYKAIHYDLQKSWKDSLCIKWSCPCNRKTQSFLKGLWYSLCSKDRKPTTTHCAALDQYTLLLMGDVLWVGCCLVLAQCPFSLICIYYQHCRDTKLVENLKMFSPS